MKRLMIALFLIICVMTGINSHTNKEVKVLVPTFVKTMMIDPITIRAKRLEKPEIPESFIADYIFNKQLYMESRNKHMIRDENGKLKLIENKRSGALGIAQFLPSTWDWLKEHKVLPKNFSIERESHQRVAQRLYMNRLAKKNFGIKYNRLTIALACYNAGPGRVGRLIKKWGLNWEEYLPRETKNYIRLIIS